MYRILIVGVFAAMLLGAACTTKKIDLASPPLSDYFPLVVGKHITYRLDSTVTTQFGRDTTVRTYRVRDRVDAQITDARGRTAYRIVRSTSNATGTAPFLPEHTFMTIPQGEDWIEHVENNLRFMKLRFPIREGFSWKGNSFIETASINSSVRYLAGWDYRYVEVEKPFTVNGVTYPNTITIHQREEVIPPGPFNPAFFKQYNFSVEVYAKGIGLIYKNFDHKVWQPPTPPPDARAGYWEDGSFRLVLRIIDHN